MKEELDRRFEGYRKPTDPINSSGKILRKLIPLLRQAKRPPEAVTDLAEQLDNMTEEDLKSGMQRVLWSFFLMVFWSSFFVYLILAWGLRTQKLRSCQYLAKRSIFRWSKQSLKNIHYLYYRCRLSRVSQSDCRSEQKKERQRRSAGLHYRRAAGQFCV